MAQATEDVEAVSRVAVDWDGTCVDDDAWPEMGDWLPGAITALKHLAGEFDEVVIFTCRVADVNTDERTPFNPFGQIAEISEMLSDADIPENVIVWTKSYKPPADYYIDNKAVRFEGSWKDVLEVVKSSDKIFTERLRESFDAYARQRSLGLHEGDPWRDDQTVWFNYPENPPPDYAPPYHVPTITAGNVPTLTNSTRVFSTGASRDTDNGKLDYEGFFSPAVLKRRAEYMHEHRQLPDGSYRDSDNWQKGIPVDAYMKSMWRHFMDVWEGHRSGVPQEDLETALCALAFNVDGMLFELLKSRPVVG